ncbi:hypothetical protein AB1Y20_022123 [Prymnesium parvum]|uniref:non-specific serine/threonine protein kinase n=1 Tax=Prymnesium parvum TaxID=97485 RepID=A0AB34JHG4_PRYPA
MSARLGKQATNLETHEQVAIKIFDKTLITDNSTAEQIKKEIAVMMLVHQRHVVNLIEVLASRSKVFIVLELVTGGELFDRVVRSGRFDERTARRYFQQLVTGLDYCHRKGVCHRDLKPENLLLDEATGDLKISDFGLSALYSAKESRLLHTSCGTPNYVAPEVLGDKGYDGFMADVWSCGVILFVMLAGFLPFDEPSMSALFNKILRAEYAIPEWFSPGARDLLSKVLQPSPSARFSLAQIKSHRWFNEGNDRPSPPFGALEAQGGEAAEAERPASRRQLERGGSWNAMVAEGEAAARARAAGRGEAAEASLLPQTINAFELITLCGGLHLLPMFAGDAASLRRSTRFHSQRPPAEIMARLQHVLAAELGADCRLLRDQFKIVATLKHPNGLAHRSIAQVFTIAQDLYLVDWRREQGDIASHYSLYQNIRARVSDLIAPHGEMASATRLDKLLSPQASTASIHPQTPESKRDASAAVCAPPTPFY